EVVHIDHTELDVQLVDSRTGQPTGRPWATLMVDAFSRRVLAVYLTFDSPSYRSCMMVIRECVHRHHRLPECVVVDWGAEFESVYFETLLARYEVNKATRPKAKPRFRLGTSRLVYFIARQQGFKVDTLELRSPINDNAFPQAVVPMNTFSDHHHTAAIAGRIKGQIHGQHPPRKRIHHQGGPWASGGLTSSGIYQLDVQFRMINMDHFKWAISMPGKSPCQIPVQRFVGVGHTRSRTFFHLFVTWSPIDHSSKRFVTGKTEDSLSLAGINKLPIDLSFAFLFGVFIFLLNEVREDFTHLLAQARLTIPFLMRVGKQTKIATPIFLGG